MGTVTLAKPQSRHWRPVAGRVCTLGTAVVCIALGTTAPAAQDKAAPGFMILDLVVDRQIFESICELLAMDEGQAAQAAVFHEAYLRDAKTLDNQVKEGVDDAGFRRLVQLWKEARYKGLDAYPWDEMARLRRQYHKESVAGLEKADASLNEWYDQLQELILSQEQRAYFDGVPRLVRRLNAQRRHRIVAPSDFRGGIDVFVLVQEASKDDGELATIVRMQDDGEQTDQMTKARAELGEILDDYEILLDQLLLEDLNRRRKRLGSKDGIIIDSDGRAGRRLIRQWAREYALTASTVEQIADVVERAGGPEHRETWLDRFHRAFCPALLAERWPDRMGQWLEERSDATDEQREAVKALYNEYLIQRRHARESAIAAGVNAKRKHFSAQGDNPSQLRYLRHKLRLKRLTGLTVDHFRSLLAPEQVWDLDAELSRARIYRPVLLGPHVDGAALQKFTGEEPMEGVTLPPIDPQTGQRDPNFGKYGEQQNEQETVDGFH